MQSRAANGKARPSWLTQSTMTKIKILTDAAAVALAA